MRVVELSSRSGVGDGFRGDLPLELEPVGPVVLDASRLGTCHPMFVIRLRLFLDWHLSVGHDVSFVSPRDLALAQQLADMGVVDGLVGDLSTALPVARGEGGAMFPVRRLQTPDDVEDASADATDVLHQQAPALAAWGDPVYMAVSELCGNALQHGRTTLVPTSLPTVSLMNGASSGSRSPISESASQSTSATATQTGTTTRRRSRAR